MPRLSEKERNQAVGLLYAGISIRGVARQFNWVHSTITRLTARFGLTGSTPDRLQPGQPRVTTPAQDGYIRVLHLLDRFRPATQTAVIT